MSEQYMYLKMTKEWGESKVGDVVRFGFSKGLERIAAGEGIRVKKSGEVETAMVTPRTCTGIPKSENAILDIKAKADAKAKAKEKAKADADKKAKAEAKAKTKAKAKNDKKGN